MTPPTHCPLCGQELVKIGVAVLSDETIDLMCPAGDFSRITHKPYTDWPALVRYNFIIPFFNCYWWDYGLFQIFKVESQNPYAVLQTKAPVFDNRSDVSWEEAISYTKRLMNLKAFA